MVANIVMMIVVVAMQMGVVMIGHIMQQVMAHLHGAVKNHRDSINDHDNYAGLHHATKLLFSLAFGN
jgi:cell division protein FtsL